MPTVPSPAPAPACTRSYGARVRVPQVGRSRSRINRGDGSDAPACSCATHVVTFMIATARLLLRPFSLTDVPKVFAMGDEAGMRRWIPDQVYRDERHAEHVVTALMA